MDVNLSDKAISRGYFVCVRIQVRKNHIYLNNKHIELLNDSAEIGLSSPLDESQIKQLVEALHKASNLAD